MQSVSEPNLVESVLSQLWSEQLEKAIALVVSLYETLLLKFAELIEEKKVELVAELFGLPIHLSSLAFRLIQGGELQESQKPILRQLHRQVLNRRRRPIQAQELRYLNKSISLVGATISDISKLDNFKELWDLTLSKPINKEYRLEQHSIKQIDNKEESSQLFFTQHNELKGRGVAHYQAGFHRHEFEDGSVYEGFWSEGLMSGKGKMVAADGDSYEGEWKLGHAHGYGEYKVVGGSTFQGEWKENLKDGYGIERWADKSIYEGWFLKGKRSGKGLHQWSDGSYYEGEWQNSKPHGQGKHRWVDGREYDGEWQYGQMHGRGKFTWPDGRVYSGSYKCNKKDGPGSYTDQRGRTTQGLWVSGKLV